MEQKAPPRKEGTMLAKPSNRVEDIRQQSFSVTYDETYTWDDLPNNLHTASKATDIARGIFRAKGLAG
jgi:hypothetical protein